MQVPRATKDNEACQCALINQRGVIKGIKHELGFSLREWHVSASAARE